MFGIILAVVVTVMQVYVFWRAASVPLVHRTVSHNELIIFGFMLWVAFLFSRFSGLEESGLVAVTLNTLSMTWMAVLFLMTISLISVEVVSGFGFLLKRFVPRLRGLALIAGGLLAVIALIQGMRAPVIQDYQVTLAGLPVKLDGTVIIALSDLHLGTELDERWLEQVVKQVQAEKPDIIVLTGDIFEGHGTPKDELFATLRQFSAPLGIWAVTGNHEFHGGVVDNNLWFEKSGVHLLHNTWVELRPGLILAGVDNLATGNDTGQAQKFLAQALKGRPSGSSVLLSHAPLQELAGKGADLVLSGHTHGGQIWPFGYLVKQRFPLLEGRYELAGTTFLVSRGTGTWGPRMRLWHPAEILRVTLHSQERG